MLNTNPISVLNKGNALLFVFAVLSVTNIAAGIVQVDWLGYLTKPMLVSCLAIWFYLNTDRLLEKHSKAFFLGLWFSVAGDTFLMFVKTHGELFFLFGLGSFLFAHLCYIIAFYVFPSVGNGAISSNKYYVIPFFLLLIAVIWFLWNDLGAFRIPVVAYSTVIISMAAFSFNMSGRVPSSVAQMLFWGGTLFVFSDFFIALNKFKYQNLPQAFSGLMIMSTYLLGQFLLTTGMKKACD